MHQVPARDLILIPYCYLRDRYFYLYLRDEETKATVFPGTLWLQTIENYSGYVNRGGFICWAYQGVWIPRAEM